MRVRTFAVGLGLALGCAASPALAQYVPAPDYGYGYGYDQAYPAPAAFPIDHALAERCGLRAGMSNPWPTPVAYYDGPRRRDDGVGGALIGGAVGGVIGNGIAGHGDRVVGTVAGAAIGAAAGAAIDRAEDRNPGPRAEPIYGADYADECTAALPPGYRLVSVPGTPDCHDEVVTHEEWVPEYVTEPAPRRLPRRAPPRSKLRRIK